MQAIFNAPEIVILVFQSCDDVHDDLALASTCKYLAAVWHTHAASVLLPLLEAKIAGFKQALLAVSCDYHPRDAILVVVLNDINT